MEQQRTKKYRELVLPHVKSGVITKWLKEEYLTDKELYTRLGIGKSAFYDYKENYSEFTDAIMEGRQNLKYRAEKSLYRSAYGSENSIELIGYVEEIFPNGSIKLKKEFKKVEPNINALKQLGAMKWGQEWNVAQIIEATHSTSSPLDDMSFEELTALLATLQEVTEGEVEENGSLEEEE